MAHVPMCKPQDSTEACPRKLIGTGRLPHGPVDGHRRYRSYLPRRSANATPEPCPCLSLSGSCKRLPAKPEEGGPFLHYCRPRMEIWCLYSCVCTTSTSCGVLLWSLVATIAARLKKATYLAAACGLAARFHQFTLHAIAICHSPCRPLTSLNSGSPTSKQAGMIVERGPYSSPFWLNQQRASAWCMYDCSYRSKRQPRYLLADNSRRIRRSIDACLCRALLALEDHRY